MTSIEKGNEIIASYERGELSYDEAHEQLMAIEPLLELELFAASQCL